MYGRQYFIRATLNILKACVALHQIKICYYYHYTALSRDATGDGEERKKREAPLSLSLSGSKAALSFHDARSSSASSQSVER